MKKKAYAGGGVGMKKKSYAAGGTAKMPMAKDPKTGQMKPVFAMDDVGKMAKGGMKKKKAYAAGGASMKKKSYAIGGTTMTTPKNKKTRTGTVVPTMMPPMTKMSRGGNPSKKKVGRGR